LWQNYLRETSIKYCSFLLYKVDLIFLKKEECATKKINSLSIGINLDPWEQSKQVSGEVKKFTIVEGSHILSICLSLQTPPSVLKLESWNFAYRLLILIPKELLERFLKFCLGLRYGGFLGQARRVKNGKQRSTGVCKMALP